MEVVFVFDKSVKRVVCSFTFLEDVLMRRLQIGVVGSAADVNYNKSIAAQAYRVGREIARLGHILVFGAEKDVDSLSSAACRGAQELNGMTIGVTYGKYKDILCDPSVIIPTGMDRGGGREYVLMLCCDVAIAIAGGSGTLNELTVAYQADIPMIALRGTGGWSDALADRFLDLRMRRRVTGVDSPEEAVRIAIEQARLYVEQYG